VHTGPPSRDPADRGFFHYPAIARRPVALEVGDTN
jgi:hypothetical protein